MISDLDSAHLEVAVVRAPLGGLLAGVLIVPINGILKIRNGEIIQANHFMRCLGVLKFYRVVKPHLHSRMLENFSLQTLNDLLGVRHCESVLFGSTLLSKSYNKTATRDICRFVLFRKSHKSLTQSDLHIGFFSCTILLVTRRQAGGRSVGDTPGIT